MSDDADDPPAGSRDDGAVVATDDASDPKAVARRARKAKQKDDDRGAFWRRTLADPIGRLVIWELLQDCRTFQVTFAVTPAGFPCPEQTWFHAGQKDIGERLYRSLLRIDRLAVVQIHDEHDPLYATPKLTKPQRSDDE